MAIESVYREENTESLKGDEQVENGSKG